MIELENSNEEPKDNYQGEDNVDEGVEPDEGKLLVIQRSLHADLKKEEPWQRDALFHTWCTSHGKVCLVIVDSKSCTNAVSKEMVTKLGLKTERHLKPYNIRWLQDDGRMKITKRCLVPFSIGKIYNDEKWCDVMKMDVCQLLLGRPWKYDRHVQHVGYLNTYSFTKDGHKVTLKPLHPNELAKRHKAMQDTLMTRSEIVGHINKGEHVLIAVSIE